MHELADAQRILEVALQRAQAAGAGRIADLHLVVGHASRISDEAVQFYWDSISRGTLAEGARLHFRFVAAETMCLDCDTRFATQADEEACPACGSFRVRVVSGEDFYLEAIDVASADETGPALPGKAVPSVD